MIAGERRRWAMCPFFVFGAGRRGLARREDLQTALVPAIEALGFELWGIELIAHARHTLLRIYIDSAAGITVDDCASVSRHAGSALDVADLIAGAYTLEVSSPGLDRPLFTQAQFERYCGQAVKVRLAYPVEGQRNCQGKLLKVDDDAIEVEHRQDARIRLSFAAIKKANLVF